MRAVRPAAVLALGIALTVAGCSNQDQQGAAEGSVDGDQPSATGTPTPSLPPLEVGELPVAEPSEGQAEDYLADRVPEGVDPAAILEAGVEACNRMYYLEAVDPDVLAEALAGDEGQQGWIDAVEHLCPDLAEYAP